MANGINNSIALLLTRQRKENEKKKLRASINRPLYALKPTSSYSYTHNYNGTTVSTIDIATANLKFKTKVFASVANQLFWRRATVAPKFSRTGRSEPQISVKGDVAAGGAQSVGQPKNI